ncbi:phosphotransferase family protein [Aliikangiella marina]|uniref:Phosphotransferase family protein n=1 Tax=Aliikangiella marina TaxID=1712262 RepID=A0A545TH84_9GAMM|nr:phosphotransferase family protein [Aliikangiella marina]TQV76593.1 phosphotransferase family protein [Aliikangiella marina]
MAESGKLLDKAGAVRSGEELPVAEVDTWLKTQNIELIGAPSVTQYSGGASNWTYCLTYENREIILRRAPAGTKAKGAHDMGREFRIQSALKPVYAYVPEMLALCEDESVLGTDFYVMEKLNGIIPRKNMPRGLKLDPATTKTICEKVLDCLIELHQADYQAAGLDQLAKGEGYIRRQIEGWNGRYKKAKTWNVPSAKYVMSWLEYNMPNHENICIIHNDFRFDNVVLDNNEPTKVLGVLDWEMATLGDPMMDLGNTLAYWVEQGDDFMAQSTRRQPTHLPGMMTRQQVIEYYCDKMGFDALDFKFYEVYGLFRLAVIVQQIYFRYHHKQTTNPAFKKFWLFVHYLLWRSKKAIKRKGI